MTHLSFGRSSDPWAVCAMCAVGVGFEGSQPHPSRLGRWWVEPVLNARTAAASHVLTRAFLWMRTPLVHAAAHPVVVHEHHLHQHLSAGCLPDSMHCICRTGNMYVAVSGQTHTHTHTHKRFCNLRQRPWNPRTNSLVKYVLPERASSGSSRNP